MSDISRFFRTQSWNEHFKEHQKKSNNGSHSHTHTHTHTQTHTVTTGLSGGREEECLLTDNFVTYLTTLIKTVSNHTYNSARSGSVDNCNTAQWIKTIPDQVMSQLTLSDCSLWLCSLRFCAGGVMWHSPCTQWLTAAGSPLNFLNSPPPLHTTNHGSVPLNSHQLITSSAGAVTSDRQFADGTCSIMSQQCWQFRLQ